MPEAGGAAPAAAPAEPRSTAPVAGAAVAAGRRPPLRRFAPLLCLAAGVVHAWSFAPANLPWLALLALAVVLRYALQAPDARAGAAAGFAFGCGWLGLGLWWIYISLHEYGGLAAPLAGAATALLAAGLALLPALALALAAARTAPGTVGRAGAIVAAWTLAEWLRGVLFGGMPWLSTGYAHTDGPLAGYAPLIGVYGVGAMAALVAVAPLLAWPDATHRGRAQAGTLAGALALPLAVLALGQALRGEQWSQPQGAPIRVRLVQGNIAQDIKFGDEGLDTAVARYLPALRADAKRSAGDHAPHEGTPRPDLIVLPESAFPVPVNDLPDEVMRVLADERERDGAALIFGAFVVEPRRRYFNSAIGLGPDSIAPQRYSKRHLVPFGEFIPFGFRWFVDLLRIPIGDQERGERYQPPMALAGQQIAVNICFEDLFGAQILDAWHDPQRTPTLLLNLSNLGWFDDSPALAQHLQISRMRALETARPLLRATNTGITAIIDARGRVSAQLPIQTQAVLDGQVQGMHGDTPFTWAGNLPILLACGALLLLCGWRGRSGGATRDLKPSS